MTHPTDPGSMQHGDRAPDGPVTLAGFLAARLDEDEAAANRASCDPVGAMEAHFEAEALHEEQDWRLYPERKTEYSRGQADALHWASVRVREQMRPLSLHDPSRVLREVEAKRRLLRLADSACPGDCLDHGPEMHATEEHWGAAIRSALAAIWSGHPDYQDQWKP
jgi:hypothetical protein